MPSDVSTKFALVIPTLNEGGNIEPLVQRIRSALDPLGLSYEVIFVDDGSADGTQENINRLATVDPRVKLLVRHGQKGLAGAVVHGWQHTGAELLGVMDADLQHPPELIPSLLAGVEQGHDIAIGSRYVQANKVAGWNPFRQAVSLLSTLATVPLQRAGVRVKDPMSGFFIVRRACIDGIELRPQGFKILLEVLVRGRIRSALEVPYQFGQRLAGKSKADAKVALDYLAQLTKLSRDVIFRSGPQ
jgi:dolichol-phosphate mannosyltransferase